MGVAGDVSLVWVGLSTEFSSAPSVATSRTLSRGTFPLFVFHYIPDPGVLMVIVLVKCL